MGIKSSPYRADVLSKIRPGTSRRGGQNKIIPEKAAGKKTAVFGLGLWLDVELWIVFMTMVWDRFYFTVKVYYTYTEQVLWSI